MKKDSQSHAGLALFGGFVMFAPQALPPNYYTLQKKDYYTKCIILFFDDFYLLKSITSLAPGENNSSRAVLS